VLLHAGVSAYWPLVKAAPAKQIRAYEATVQTLRQRWDLQTELSRRPGRVRRVPKDGYRGRDVPGPMCRALGRPVAGAGRGHRRLCGVSVLQGTVLRWLADCNDETTLVVLDDLVSSLATRATEV